MESARTNVKERLPPNLAELLDRLTTDIH